MFKYNDTFIKTFEKLKTENKDMANVLDWLEEYSTLKMSKLDAKEQGKKLGSPMKELKSKYFSTLENSGDFKLSINREENFISISDDIISEFEETTFNIFNLEKEVGEKNTLSTICCYVFSTMGFYSFINYGKFENFVYEITKGYSRKNPYHNVNK